MSQGVGNFMEAIDFNPPGPGFWQLDRSHFPGGTTPIARELVGTAGGGLPSRMGNYRYSC